MKSEKNGKTLAFTPGELEAMHNHTGDDRLLFLLLRWTGLRLGEAINLTWGEVSFKRQQIEYVQQKSPRKSIRWIPTELLSALRAEHRRRNPRQNEPVLQNVNGKPFKRGHLLRRIMALGRRSGVQHILPYRFRHTFACELLLHGVAPLHVAEQLGVNIETVIKHYSSFAGQHVEAARSAGSERQVLRLRKREKA